jgi:hypothetical protein
MTTPLAAYITTLMGDRTLREVATAGLSRSALHQMVTGTTTKPTPDSLTLLARYFGNTDVERSEIYATLMGLSGYLDPLFPAAYRVVEQEDFEENARAWLTTLEAEADTVTQRDFVMRLYALKKHDPVQFALYYNAALTLARLVKDRV